MANVLSTMTEKMISMVKDTISLRAMRKEDLQSFLRTNIETHEKIAYVLKLQGDSVWNNWFNSTVKQALQKSQSKAKNVVYDYQKRIGGKAAQEERKRPLLSLAAANESFAEVLEDISKNIDKLLETDAINLNEVRISHLAVLGILRQSDMVLNFSMYLYAFLVRSVTHTASALPRYREMYLMDKCDRVASIITDLLNKKGPYTFLGEVKSLRAKQADLILGIGGAPTGAMLSQFSSSFLDNIATALSCLNIFSAMLNAWDNYKMRKYERNKETKEWLEQHVSLLRMDLEEMDKTSPQYQKTLAIIKAYDEKIAEYDQEITKFEQED